MYEPRSTWADRFEKEGLDWHRRLRDSFLSIARANPDRVIVLSADQPEAGLADAVWSAVVRRFPEISGIERR